MEAKVLFLAGDFRQCLIIIPNADRSVIGARCINSSVLWSSFKICELTKNLRLKNLNDHKFDEFLTQVGDGIIEQINPSKFSALCVDNWFEFESANSDVMEKFADLIFPDINKYIQNIDWLKKGLFFALLI